MLETLLIIASIISGPDSTCNFTLSDKYISITVVSSFKANDTLQSVVQVRNISNETKYIIKYGYESLMFFPYDTSAVNLDLTSSKIRLGNAHYYHFLTQVEEFLPKQTISFSIPYSTPKSPQKEITFTYEYLPDKKKIRDNKIIGLELVKRANKLTLKCNCSFW